MPSPLRLPFRLEGRELLIKASVGISLYPDDGIEIDALLRNSDVAMYPCQGAGPRQLSALPQSSEA